MAQSLDHLVLVGFTTTPDESTSQGESALRKLSDAANVAMNNIHFFPAGTDQMDIIRGSFKKDKASKYGYNFGNSIVIVSGDVDTAYRLKMKQMKKIEELDVKLDYQDVDFMRMQEAALSEWIETGMYDSSNIPDDDEEDGDIDPIASILNLEIEEDSEDTPSNAYEMDDDEYLFDDDEDINDETDPALVQDIEEPVSKRVEVKNTPSNDYEVNDDKDLFNEDDEPSPAEVSEESTSTKIVNDIDSTKSDKTSFSRRVKIQNIEDEVIPKEDTLIEDTSNEEDNEFFEQPDPKRIANYIDEEVEEEKLRPNPRFDENRKKSVIDNSMQKLDEEYSIDENSVPVEQQKGDNEYIDKMRENRQKNLKKQKSNMRDNLLAEIGNMNNNLQSQPRQNDELFSDRANAISGDRREDGTRKSFKDYLSETDRKVQDVEEQTIKDFGDFRTGKAAVGQDSHYTGVNMGRVILVTSGKGGVGKSIIANGMAMALSLARAANLAENPGANDSTTWLIESDWNSPKLCEAYQTGRKHLGNVAAILTTEEGGASADKLRQAIIENTFIDEETGLHILACPPLGPNNPSNSKMIGYAILRAIDYAVKNNGSVIVDHGNLTAGVYSSFDNILSTKIAHRVVIVADMGCLPETQSILSMLTQRGGQSRSTVQDVMTVSVVLNKAREEQYYMAQDRLKPFEIIQRIPPLADLQPENILGQGRTGLNNASDDVKRSIIARCGVILTKLGYEDLRRYFSTKKRTYNKKSTQSRGFIRRIADRFGGS